MANRKKIAVTNASDGADTAKAETPGRRVYLAWTDAMNARLAKLFPTATREELLKAFPKRKYAAIANQANRLGLKREHLNVKTGRAKPVKSEQDLLVDFLARARTDKEIVGKFVDNGLQMLAALAKNPPKGYRLREGRNRFQEKTAYLERVIDGPVAKVQKRVFQIRHSENDPDYISVIFPKDLDFTDDPSANALRIFPIDSCFWGDFLSDRDALLKYFEYINSKPYAFAFLLGDIIGGTDYTKETAIEIREDFKRHLAPIAHKILWAQSGPLEARMSRIDGVDPLHAVAQELGIYHTDRPVRMDVYWKDPLKPVEWYCLHGRSHAKKDGAKINAIINITVSNNFPHFTVLGNLKEGNVNTMTVRRLDPVSLTIKEYPAVAIICPGFKRFEGSEEEKKGNDPPATGTVVGIIKADNSHEASS